MRNRNTLTRTCHPVRVARRARPSTWDDLFDAFFHAPLLGGNPHRSTSGALSPRMDLTESEKEFTLTVELPGMTKDQLELELREDALVLRGEKKPESEADDETVLHTERRWGRFERTLRLPSEIDADAAQASFRNGVLFVRLPKAAPGDGPRKIEVGD